MHYESQTLIGVVRRFVEIWRRCEGWSEETVASVLVETHRGLRGSARTGIRFEPVPRDAAVSAKVHRERIYHWLDDERKCVHLMPANFLPSVLTAMPMAVRLQCVNSLLHPLGLLARERPQASVQVEMRERLEAVMRNDPEARAVYARLVAEPDCESLQRALQELNEAIEVKLQIRRVLEGALQGLASQSQPVRPH